jgi:hypothetical protein
LIRFKKTYWKNNQNGDYKGLFSKPKGSGKKKKLQNEINQLNMVQEWDVEIFDRTNNFKENNNYTRC